MVEMSKLDEDIAWKAVDPSHYRDQADRHHSHFIKEHVENGVIELTLSTNGYHCDIFTTALSRERKLNFLSQAGMQSFTPETQKTMADEVNNTGNPVKKILLKLNLSDHRLFKDGGGVKEFQRSFRHSDTERLSRSDEVLKLKNFKKDATLKLFKSTNQERYEHVGPEVTSSQDGQGIDDKPPMLEKHLYESWKSIMELYMMNRPHGRMILASVEKGPLVWPTITVDGVTRLKEYTELTPAETIQADCDIKAINIFYKAFQLKFMLLLVNIM
ncbi:hypothetical protein Tco_1183911 [Tanacetum coccineum]